MDKVIIYKDKVKEQRKIAIQRDLTKEAYQKQLNVINLIYFNKDNPSCTSYVKELQDKLKGYQRQDKHKWCVRRVNDTETLKKETISWDELIELLVTSKLVCSYCRCCVYILYNTTKDKEQWTLDRIDNTQPHTRDNCVISCLKCNLEKGNKSDKAFRFTKQLKIIKKE